MAKQLRQRFPNLNLGRQFGYSLVGCEFVGSNAFFVRDDLLAGKFAEPFTAETVHVECFRTTSTLMKFARAKH